MADGAAPDALTRLIAALDRPGAATSDFDRNPAAVLAADRVLRPAGVLVLVDPDPAGARLWLTKRASGLRHHPGQIALPGGKVDPGDDGPVGAALREAHEEIGLPIGAARVLGCLAPHETVTGFQVTPVLALQRIPFAAIPEAGEVDEVFSVPLAHVLNPARFHVERRRWRGEWRHYDVVPWGPYYIWGATARILRALSDRVAV
ncbi:CoA pyrophosphatase [Paracoccus sp. p3-h83]|uniref:NUDIX hydrolase n=1 Tax=Paracoccus sp. p3-h83 TaxID=3342805 RepID=UPI0035B7837A